MHIFAGRERVGERVCVCDLNLDFKVTTFTAFVNTKYLENGTR